MKGTDRQMRDIAERADRSEKSIERSLVRLVAEAGGRALKLASMTETGFPDRLCLLPGGRAFFAELKSAGRKPTPLQRERIRELAALGFFTAVIDSREAAAEVVGTLAKPAAL